MSYSTSTSINWKLRLYVAGNNPESQRVKETVSAVCQKHLKDACHLEVIDVLQSPVRAKEAGIVTVPTLLRHTPVPTRTLVGNLSDPSFVFNALGIDHSTGLSPERLSSPHQPEPGLSSVGVPVHQEKS